MKKARILVVEDEKVVAVDIEACLRKLGYEVVGSASFGAEALRRAVETEPDLVLMDIKLKGAIDGVDAAQELSHRLNLPVVYLTAYADTEILERAKKTSPSGYVLKPFDERSLRSAVELALHRHSMERKLIEGEQRMSTALRSIEEGVVLTERSGLITLMNDTAELLTGWSEEEARGRHLSNVLCLVDGESGSALPAPVSRVASEGVSLPFPGNVMLVSRCGARVQVRGKTAPIRDSEDNLLGVAVIFREADTLLRP